MDVLAEKENLMRDYWLESLSGKQVELLETDWFGNDEDSELLQIVRADLIDDYVTNNLDSVSYSQFEKHFLPNNLEDIVLAKSLIEISTEKFHEPKKKSFLESIFESVRSFASLPQIAVAALLLICFGLFIGYFIKSSINEPTQIARNNEPEIEIPNKPEIVENTNVSNKTDANQIVVKNPANKKIEPKPSNTKVEKEANKPVIAEPKSANENKPVEIEKPPIKQQILFLTTIRGSSKMLKLSNSNDNFLLKIEMPGIDKVYKHYEIRIYDANNSLVVNQKVNENLSLKKSGESITSPNLKTDKFKKNNTYKTALVGIDDNNEVKELCVYDSFKVN
jgi:hypothetical protein